MSAKLLVGQQLDGQILYARQKQIRASQTILPAPIIIAAGLQTPENIGSVLRLADAAGSPRVIFVNVDTPQHWNRIQRTARNCAALVAWEFWTPAQFLEQRDTLPPLIALELTTDSTNIFETALPNSCALIVGSERHGIPAPLLAQCQRAIHIPMYGVNGSMNVTHALAIALFEWRRQHAPK
jgi:tRNA G18 (ribose-2'-O)-methylase SpoU